MFASSRSRFGTVSTTHQRHFNDYRRAAEILDVIGTRNDDGMARTNRGREFVGTPEGIVDERRVFATAARRPPRNTLSC